MDRTWQPGFVIPSNQTVNIPENVEIYRKEHTAFYQGFQRKPEEGLQSHQFRTWFHVKTQKRVMSTDGGEIDSISDRSHYL